jgi:cytochrome c553
MRTKALFVALQGLALLVVLAALVVGFLGGRPLAREWDVPLEPIALPTDSASIEEGGRLARITGCRACHDEGLTGGYAFSDDLLLGRVVAVNLTRILPSYTDAELVRLLRHGVREDGTSAVVVPSEMFVHLADEDLARIIAWLRTVPPAGETYPKRKIGLLGKLGLLTGKYRTAADLVPAGVRWPERRPGPDDGAALGRYLAMTTCTECHGQDLAGFPDEAPSLAIAAAYTPEQFRHLLRTGEALGGRRLEFMSEVSESRFRYFTDGEIDALYGWLSAPDASGAAARP